MPVAIALLLGSATAAFAGPPRPGQMGFQPPVTPVMEDIEKFHDLLLIIITSITVFVLILLLIVMWRFSEKRNPTPSKTTHNTWIEVAWTVVPILILIAIVFPSFSLLYKADVVPETEMTVKVIGKQWYWTFEYPDNGNFTFDAIKAEKDELEDKSLYLLATDNPVVLPVDTNIKFLVTAADVLHDFALPAFGIKLDAVPGRLNETWAYVPERFAGETFYGQCSELCGSGHAFMPVTVKMVSKADYEAWVKEAQEEFARIDAPETRTNVADASGVADFAQ
ncbi:MAG TPA: cytochrome c oxidase subunit II [Kiloniellaceae bacterium]|nr:cytochrome c oxidase subunit II [Kiloniellaceae bacterium]